jgi:tetratricopeptide (TPR) repeat protein
MFRLPQIIVATVLALAATAALAQDAARLAREGFHAIEAEPFDPEAVMGALRKIDAAYKASPNDPWVRIAISRAFMERGYMRGDRARLASYDADSVKAADRFARAAVEAGPREAMAHIMVARMQILTEDYRGAWETINRAHTLEPGFYPWYYRGVVSLKMKDAKRAAEAFAEAGATATIAYQKEWAVARRIDVAKLNRDVTAEEQAHKDTIALAKNKAHAHGNYGNFLKFHKRYDEAIEQYHQALAIVRYSAAEESLKQTLMLRDAKK